MYLKQLYLRGFKTFAEPTTLEFDEGITAIVGPNGVGKSNIVDAVLWVLGEQSPRALRTSSLQEVIFAGTEQRRPLGMAEVTVTLDNSDGSLPTHFVEVEITRRLFRSGQSEYMLNRSPCRLRDVRDMLLDTGLGPQAYSVIGQGEIEAILSVRPEDRRELIEEAAGVRKYRVRRDQAERRLEKTKAELRRLRDIIVEVASHLGPLEEEAERAREYAELEGRLRELELRLMAAEYASRQRRRGRLANDRAVAKQELEAGRARLAELNEELAQVRRQLHEAAALADQLREEAAQLEHTVREVRYKRDAAHERQASIAHQVEAFQEAVRAAAERKRALGARLSTLDQERRAVSAEIQQAQQELEGIQARSNQLEKRLADEIAERQQRERLVASLAQRISRAEQEAVGLHGLATELAERIQRLEAQASQMGKRRDELEARRNNLHDSIPTLQQRAELACAKLEQATQRWQQRQRWLDEHRAKMRLLRENLAAVEAILRTLKQVRESKRSLPTAATEVLSAARAGRLSGVVGLVRDLMTVPARLEKAVMAALGERAEWVVVHGLADAAAVAEFVREKRLGRVGIIILDLLPREQVAPPQVQGPGIVGNCAQMVTAEPELAPLVEQLLGNVLVVTDLDVVLGTAEQNRAVVLASLDGAVIAAPGQLVIGADALIAGSPTQPAKDETRARERREHILQAEARLVAIEARLENMARGAGRSAADAGRQAQEAEKALRDAQAELAEVEQSLEAAEAAISDANADLALLRPRLATVETRRQLAEETARGLREELKAVRASLDEGPSAVAQELEECRGQLTAAQIRLARLEQRLQANDAERQRTREELEVVAVQLAEGQARLDALLEAAKKVQAALDALPEVEPLEQRLAAAQVKAEKERGRLQELDRKQAELEQAIASVRERVEDAGARLHSAELALAREEAHLADLAERIRDQFDMDPQRAVGLIQTGFTRSAAERQARQLKEKIRALGPVNLGAAQELERLKARHDYLQAQLEDVSRARDDLLELIEELDRAAQEEFLRAFHEVGLAFQHTFSRLFNGGETRLDLTNPDDPLDGGVEIIVRPPGKRRQNMMLLSGGEKALTALAFVFALLEVRPSPFCVLDEIDAALDASSTDRFIELLRDFAHDTQFIVVTHNPQTIAAADTLYGVTMQTPGVSLVLAVDLKQAQELARQQAVSARLRVTPAT